MTEGFSHLHLSREGRVLTVAFHNPPFNFLTGRMMEELGALLDDLVDDASVGSVVLTSELPDVFLTHFDVAEIKAGAEAAHAALPAGAADVALRVEGALEHVAHARKWLGQGPLAGVSGLNRFHEVCARMRGMDKVFVAAINGRAMGGGCELSLSCDLRVLADHGDEALMGQPEVLVGIIPGGGGSQMLPRLIGAARALELCLEGAPIPAQRALEIGLVHRVVKPDALQAEAQALAERMARRPAFAVRALKRAIHEGGSNALNQGMALEKAEFLACATQPAARRAMIAYADRVGAAAERGEALRQEDMQDWIDGTAFDYAER